MPSHPEPLTPAQRRFVEEYAAEPNATQAYRRAFPGCTYATAKSEGSRFLAKPNIAEEVLLARQAYKRSVRTSAVRLLRELAAIAHADPDDIWGADAAGRPVLRPWADIPPAARRTIQSVKVKRRRVMGDEEGEWHEVEEVEVKQHAKDAAIDKLCRHLGLTKDGAGLEALRGLLAGLAAGGGAAADPAGGPPAVGGDADPAAV